MPLFTFRVFLITQICSTPTICFYTVKKTKKQFNLPKDEGATKVRQCFWKAN